MNKTPFTPRRPQRNPRIPRPVKLLLTCCLLMAGTMQGLAWDTEPDGNGKYDTYYDRPTHFPDWQQPSDWPNAEYYLVCARFGEEGPQVENYEVAVYDQEGRLRHCKRSTAKDNHFCVLTIRGTEGDQFHCQVIYGDDFQNPTIVDVPETFGFKTNDIVGSADKPFGLTVTSLLGDANGDGLVDSADVTAIVNKINGVPQPRFNEKAANVNQDDAVNIADVAGVIKIIISNK